MPFFNRKRKFEQIMEPEHDFTDDESIFQFSQFKNFYEIAPAEYFSVTMPKKPRLEPVDPNESPVQKTVTPEVSQVSEIETTSPTSCINPFRNAYIEMKETFEANAHWQRLATCYRKLFGRIIEKPKIPEEVEKILDEF